MNISDRLSLLLSRATIKNSEREAQTNKLSVDSGIGEPFEVEQYEPYGYAFNPPDGSEALMFSPGGYGDYTFSFLVQDRIRKRPELKKGEAALYASEKIYVRVSSERGIDLSSTRLNIQSEEAINLQSKSIKISNGDSELFSLLSDLLAVLSNLSVKTDNGLLQEGVKAELEALKLKIDAFK